MAGFNLQQIDNQADLKKIQNYIFMLNEQLKYMFSNLEPDENFSSDALTKYLKDGENIAILELSAKEFKLAMKDAEGNISELRQTASSLTSKLSNVEGDVSVLEQTATSLTSRIGNAEGDISVLSQTATSLTSRISNAEGDLSVLSQTATSLTSRISNAEGSISTVSQTADKINWVVSSGGSSSSFTLTSKMASLIANEFSVYGCVTFNDLSSSSGKTVINGGNIKTGTIDASVVNVKNIDVSTLKANGSTIFEMVGPNLHCVRSLVSNKVDTTDIHCSNLTVGSHRVFSGGGVSLGIHFGGYSLSSNATTAEIVKMVNKIISWIYQVN